MSITRKNRVGISWIFSALTIAMSFPTCLSFVIDRRCQPIRTDIQVGAGREISDDSIGSDSRRDFLSIAPVAVISSITGMNLLMSQSAPALAAEAADELPTRAAVTECFDYIRFELESPEGGIAYMQGRIDKEDFDGLLDFSKTYDIEFRKRRFKAAKKFLQDKETKSKATEYANAVTFDLIGINRSCRKGQENIESANKYLQELRDDVTKFLALEKTIEVQ